MNAESELVAAVERAYLAHTGRPTISPSWLATEAMIAIGFPRSLHPLGYLGCHLQMRQIARGFCRQHFEPEETVEDDLFPDTLQQRYPSVKGAGGEPIYVVLDAMSDDDVAYNVARLRKEARAKLRHADALEAWGRRKFGRTA
jgi:hypothetical protein